MTAAAVTSADAAARTVTTVRTADLAALLPRLPVEGGLSWVRRGEGLVAWGEAPLGTQPTEGQLRQVKQLLQTENTFHVEKLWRLIPR